MREIQLGDAKANLSAMVYEAMRGKPVVITRHGNRRAVVVSYEEWKRLSSVPSFGRLLRRIARPPWKIEWERESDPISRP